MFKKLSPALVAISLVAVAQPALGQGSGHKCITIESKTENSVTGTKGSTWTYAPGAAVLLAGKRAHKDEVKIGMFCMVFGPRTSVSSFNGKQIKNGTIEEIQCHSEVPTPNPCQEFRDEKVYHRQ